MNGDMFILYTTEEGGLFQTIGWATREQYNEAKRTGVLRVPNQRDDGVGYDEISPLVFLGLFRCEDHHDFIIGGPRVKPRVSVSEWIAENGEVTA